MNSGPPHHFFKLFFFLVILISFSLNTDEKIGVIYARVSTTEQNPESQVRILEDLAKNNEIKLPYKHIIDLGKKGSDFGRKGLEDVMKLASEGKITHMVVTALDRIGRNPVESLYYTWLLREYEVKIFDRDGEVDIRKVVGMIQIVIKFLVAYLETINLSKRTRRGKQNNFSNGNWNKPVPKFYKKIDSWIMKENHHAELVIDIFNSFIRSKSYACVVRFIYEEYGVSLKNHQIKRILSDPVYMGRPQCVGMTKDDPKLAFIDEGIFNKAQEIIEKIGNKYSRKKTGFKQRVEGFINKFDYPYFKTVFPNVVVQCECGAIMDENGTKSRKGDYPKYIFKCPECGKQKIWPTTFQENCFKNSKPLPCIHCYRLDDIDVEKISEEEYKVNCNHCKGYFFTNFDPNKFKRWIEEKKRENGIKTMPERIKFPELESQMVQQETLAQWF